MSIIPSRFMAQIPALERWMVAITFDSLQQKRTVDFDLLPPAPSDPVDAGVVSPEVDVQPKVVSQGEEKFAEIFVDG